ncbi:HTH domain-containing protein [Helicobacter turcicus]|uniref:HrgA protein n=1 Tax=Helicobacter turcicus TaxID=2867412 RepID=A0ABS7JN66_9HELI|nr:HTH domain-containing protein [Helicobacter turcicus]MBX7490836.1 HrgA protein [Helicobacter turcicus]MBX7545555.1 HrgA protein [Helicobacter turcicus]
MTYKEMISEVLRQAKQPLSSEQIWSQACELGFDKELSSIGKAPLITTRTRIYRDIREGGKESQFIFASRKPTTFWLKTRAGELGSLNLDDADVKTKQKNQFHERDLHPLLVKFLYENSNFNLQCKTIYHEKSKKDTNGKDKWNYPDIVGVYFPYGDYKEETLNLLHNIKQSHYKFFSFELKISLDFSNLKESYFQAVSNSSWANEGYLVVFKEIDDEVLGELRRLNQSFGIGVIKLESDVQSSRILLSSRQKELDISTLDMLLDKNADFKNFICDVNKQIKAGVGIEIKADFDKVLDDDGMQKYLKEKHIEE